MFKDEHSERFFYLMVPDESGRMTPDVFERAISALYRPPSDFSFSVPVPRSQHPRRYIFGEQPRSASAAVTVMFNALYNAGLPFYGDLSRGEAEQILANPDG